jgi:hypothetical protein
MVLPAHQGQRTYHEDARKVRQRADRAVSMRSIAHDDAEVERQGDEDQTRQRRGCPSDHKKEVVPLVRSIGVDREHREQDGTDNIHRLAPSGLPLSHTLTTLRAQNGAPRTRRR